MTEVGEKHSIPEYLNNKVLQKCLRNGLKSPNLEIIQLKIIPGSNAGDNYTSIIHRALITYKESGSSTSQNISLIIKSNAIDVVSTQIENLGLISKEINMFQEMLPKIQALVSPAIVAPKLYDIIAEPHWNLVFQDMRALGYDMADREAGLDETHLAIVLRKTAMFHAASMQVLQKEPGIAEKYLKGMVNETSVKDKLIKAMFEGNLRQGAHMAKKIPGYEHFSPKLTKMAEHFEEIGSEAVRAKPEKDVRVLLHGDLWIDFQLSFFGSLGIDLNYLFSTSISVELLKQRMEMIKTYYYPAFAEALQTYGFQRIPTLEDIIAQVKDREVYFIIAMFGILPLVSVDREKSKDSQLIQFLDENKSDKERTAGMSSQRFIEIFKYSLKAMEGTIDEAIKNY